MKTLSQKKLFVFIVIIFMNFTISLHGGLYNSYNPDEDTWNTISFYVKHFHAFKFDSIKDDIQRYDVNMKSKSGLNALEFLLGYNQKSNNYIYDRPNYYKIYCQNLHDVINFLLQAGLQQESIMTTDLEILQYSFVGDKTIKILLELGINIQNIDYIKSGPSNFNKIFDKIVFLGTPMIMYREALHNNYQLFNTIKASENNIFNAGELASWLANYADKKYLNSIFRRAIACNQHVKLFYLGKLNKEYSPLNALAFASEYNRIDAIPYILSSFSPGTMISVYKKIIGENIASKVYADKIFKFYEHAKKLRCKEFVSTFNAYINTIVIIKMLERTSKDIAPIIMQFLYKKKTLTF